MFMNPFLTWHRIAWEMGEMALGSAQVIAFRADPAADRGEALVMGREKVEALRDSMQAMSLPLMRMHQQMAILGFSQLFSLWSSMLSVGTSRTPAQAVQRQARLMENTMNGSMIAASRAASSGADVARCALEPVHRRVKANVTRLRKKKASKKPGKAKK